MAIWLYYVLIPFRSIYHARMFIPRENRPLHNMVQNGFDPNDNSGIQNSVTLTYPPNIKDSLIALLMFIIDTMHSPIY